MQICYDENGKADIGQNTSGIEQGVEKGLLPRLENSKLDLMKNSKKCYPNRYQQERVKRDVFVKNAKYPFSEK